MSIEDQLESDIVAFFQNIEKQDSGDRKKTLRMLMDKYVHLFSTPVMLDKHDFDMIKSQAHSFFVNSAFPKKLGSNRREVSNYEATTLSVIEGTISVLNGKECFKKLPKFDYRD
jgi:hypothetical protein